VDIFDRLVGSPEATARISGITLEWIATRKACHAIPYIQQSRVLSQMPNTVDIAQKEGWSSIPALGEDL
jgi:hypothetical protein